MVSGCLYVAGVVCCWGWGCTFRCVEGVNICACVCGCVCECVGEEGAMGGGEV